MIKAIARRLVSLQFAFLSLVAASDAVALDIDFKNGTWSHPNGISANNWDSSQTTGATTRLDCDSDGDLRWIRPNDRGQSKEHR